MVSYLSHKELLAIVERGAPTELGVALASHYSQDQAIYLLLGPLKDHPEVLRSLVAYAEGEKPSLAHSLRQWLARTPFYCETKSLEEFCTQATELARGNDAEFTAFSVEKLSYQCHYCAQTGYYEWGNGARGASLWVESRDVGPAEAIHEDEYRASYWGAGWSRTLYYLRSFGMGAVCWEGPLER